MCTMNLRVLPVILENYNLKAFYRRCTYELCRRTGFYRLSENKRKRLLQESQEVFVWLPNIMTKATSKISLPETVKEEAIERANDVLNGKLRFFAGQKQMCGFPPKWMKDFEYSGIRLPHWTAIRTIDARQGDIKLVWEPSRFLFTFDRTEQRRSSWRVLPRFFEKFWVSLFFRRSRNGSTAAIWPWRRNLTLPVDRLQKAGFQAFTPGIVITKYWQSVVSRWTLGWRGCMALRRRKTFRKAAESVGQFGFLWKKRILRS